MPSHGPIKREIVYSQREWQIPVPIVGASAYSERFSKVDEDVNVAARHKPRLGQYKGRETFFLC